MREVSHCYPGSIYDVSDDLFLPRSGFVHPKHEWERVNLWHSTCGASAAPPAARSLRLLLGGTSMSETLIKVHVDLPNHPLTGGEAMWAAHVETDAYELRNVPFYAYDLNYLDVVEAVAASPSLKPSIRRVVRRSGHRTLRVFYFEAAEGWRRVPLLESLKDLGACFEGATKSLFAIDVEPGGDYEAICDRLEAWRTEGLLEYETCEARFEGTFDDLPPEGEAGAA